MSWLREILIIRDSLRGKNDLAPIDSATMQKSLTVIWAALNNIESELHGFKKANNKEEAKQETHPELPIWKKFPMRLSIFERSHEFCTRMHFGQGRLAGILHADGATMFEGTYNKVRSKSGNRWHYYIEPEAFLAALLTYPFRNPAEKALVEQYKKEKGEQQHGIGG